MLILSRKQYEGIVINNDIVISVVEIRGDKVRLGVVAPREVPVHRQGIPEVIPPRQQLPPDELAFVQAIIDQPDDDSLRLIYADFLEERGNPRGSFIRVQCELAKENEQYIDLKRQEHALWQKHSQEWMLELPPILRNEPFVRGFVETVHMTIRELLDHVEEVFSSAPIRHAYLSFTWNPASIGRLGSCPYLGKLATLDLEGFHISDSDLAVLVGSPHLAIKAFILKRNEISDAGATSLANSPRLEGLAVLDLSHNQISDPGQGIGRFDSSGFFAVARFVSQSHWSNRETDIAGALWG